MKLRLDSQIVRQADGSIDRQESAKKNWSNAVENFSAPFVMIKDLVTGKSSGGFLPKKLENMLSLIPIIGAPIYWLAGVHSAMYGAQRLFD